MLCAVVAAQAGQSRASMPMPRMPLELPPTPKLLPRLVQAAGGEGIAASLITCTGRLPALSPPMRTSARRTDPQAKPLANGAHSASALPAPSGNALAECAPFASGFAWGSVRLADVRIGGESAGSLPVQVINDAAIPSPPAACTSRGSNFGVGGNSKGILGIGMLARDCPACAATTAHNIYYACD